MCLLGFFLAVASFATCLSKHNAKSSFATVIEHNFGHPWGFVTLNVPYYFTAAIYYHLPTSSTVSVAHNEERECPCARFSCLLNPNSNPTAGTQTLIAEGVDLPNDGFGGKNAISLDGDVAAVGAPGAESVFLFHRTASAAADGGGGLDWSWGQDPVDTLVSSDFDYDVVHLLKIVHRQVRGNVWSNVPNAGGMLQ